MFHHTGQTVQGFFFPVFLFITGKKFYFDMAVFLFERRRNLLITFRISRHDLCQIGGTLFFTQRRGQQAFVIYALQDTGDSGEERIIKFNDIPAATPVFLQCFFPNFFLREIGLHLFIQQFPVGVAEAVDTLFYVSHNQIGPVVCQAFFDQRTEVVPLHAAGVLKFINHIMIDVRTGLFVDEWGVAASDHFIQQLGRIGNQHDILFLPIGGYLAGNVGQDTQRIIITYDFTGRIISGQIREQGDDTFDTIIQTVFKNTTDDLTHSYRSCFGKTAFQIIG